MKSSSEGISQGFTQNKKIALRCFFIAVAFSAFGLGLSDSILSNYFKEVYDVTAAQRGFIEFPRELPGLLCLFIVTALSFLGEIRLAVVAQILSMIGLIVLGLFTPTFAVMLVFLFINSLGMHLYIPLQDSIGLGIIGSEKTGGRMGQINGVKTAAGFVASIAVFFGFRTGFFSFQTDIKLPFLISVVFFAVLLVLLLMIRRYIGDPKINTGANRILLRKQYKYYYMLAALAGAHKQIAYVFGPWVLIEILLKQADTLAILTMIGSFVGIFFIPFIGNCIDRFGVKRILYAEGFSFLVVYILFGAISAGMVSGSIAKIGIPVLIVYVIFIFDKMTMALSMTRVIYLRSIALDQSEITPTLSTGISIDHAISIASAYLGGLAWTAWGPQFVFFLAAALSLANVVVARLAPIKPVAEG